MSLLDKEVDVKTVRGLIIEKLITAVCWGVCGILLWQFTTAYKIETKLDNHIEKTDYRFAKEKEETNLAILNQGNEAVKREADMLARINAVESSSKLRKLEAIMEPPPPLNQIERPIDNMVKQSPLDYERMHRREFKKE